MKAKRLFLLIIAALLAFGLFACGKKTDSAPVIEGAVDRVIEKGSTFKPTEGITATDKEDGDLTSKIKYSGNVRIGAVGEYEATYSVTDSAGNTTTVTVKITVVANDKDAPLLTGTQNKAIVVGDTLFKLTDGVTANDTTDGDLTSKIEITGTIDPWTLGDYEIVYSVKDESGNEAKATRKITDGLGVFQFDEPQDKTFEKDGNDYKFAVSLDGFNEQLASFALAKLSFKVNAGAACELVPSITNGTAQDKLALKAGDNEVTIYFRVNAAIADGALKLAAPNGATLTFSNVKFAFGEAKDTEAPVISVPEDQEVVLPGTLTDLAALKSFVLNGVSAQDNIDGIVTSKLDVDFTGIDVGNCFEEKEVTIFAVDNSGNRGEVKRTVQFVKVYDTKLIKDPTFTTPYEPYDENTHIGWGLNGGGGDPELKIQDGMLVHHNRTNDNPGWDSASSPFFRTTTEYLTAYNWYMLKFDVKAEVARKMTVRIGLETTEALGWIENFSGAFNTPFNLTTDWQTCYVVFYVHAEESQAGYDVAKIELKIGTYTWGGEEQGNTVYFDNLQLYLLTNENSAPKLTVNDDLPTTFGKGASKPDLTQYVTARDLEDAEDITITAAHITEALDMSKVGTYDVVYKVADSEGKEAIVTIKFRILEEADGVAPVLTESGKSKEFDQFAGTPNLADLINAKDAVDGDIVITSKMIETDADFTKAGEYEVTYKVKDSSGNLATLTITIKVNDKEAPVITGKDTIKTSVGKPLTENDIIKTLAATDNVDGDIALTAENVKGLDKVDFANAGEYQITVEVSDSKGNKAVFEIKVVVKVAGATVKAIGDKIIDLTDLAADKAESCTITKENDEYKLVISELGGWASANKCKFAGLELTEGETYVLKFIAKANEPRKVRMNLGVGLWADPWMDKYTISDGYDADLSLTTEYKEYTIMFVADKANRDGGPSLEFCVGPIDWADGEKAGNDIYFKELAIYNTKDVAAETATETHNFLEDQLNPESSTATFEDGVLTIDMTEVGGWASANKIKMTGFEIEDGKTYELRVKIKVDTPRKIQFNIGIGLWADPWMDKFTLAEADANILDVTSDYQEFAIRFTADKANRDGGPTIEFCYGHIDWSAAEAAGNKVYVTELKLFEIEGGAGQKANVTFFEDGTVGSPYASDLWTQEKYTTQWDVVTGQMNCREKDGVKVVNFVGGYSMTHMYTYNKDGNPLGLANSLTFKMGNYFSGAADMPIKVFLIDEDGERTYLLGSADDFYTFPVTTGLEDKAFTFDAINVVSLVFVTKSPASSSVYLYVGDMLLSYK